MSPPLERDPVSLTSLQGGVALFALLLLLAVWLFTAYQLNASREQILDSHATALNNLSYIVAENLDQLLDRARTLRLLVDNQPELLQSGRSSDMAALMLSDPVFNRLGLYDRSGRLRYSTSPGGLVRLESAWMQPQVNAEQRGLWALPSEAQHQVWSLPLLLPPSKQANEVCCHLLLELDLGYLLNLYQHLELGDQASIQILTERGEELAKVERGGLVQGGERFDNSVILRSRLNQGRFSAVELDTGQPFLSLFQQLDNFPFVVVVRQAEQEVLAQYRGQRAEYILTVMLLSIVVLIGLAWLLWMMHVRETHMHELERSEQRNQRLLYKLSLEHQQTLEAASRDHLTGLYNRRLFLELAGSHLLGTKRQGRFAAICFIDLDRFKAINDTLGHKVGDQLLQAVAARLTTALRESDIISRFGGDEFVLMLTGVKRREDIEHKVGCLVDELSAPYAELGGSGLTTSPSIGVAVSPRDGLGIETLVKHADMAMYKAKKAGRGQYAFFDTALSVQEADEASLARVLPGVMDTQIGVYLQPRQCLPDYATTGFEALVRWESPEFGLLPPARLLPLAQSLGLMPALTRQVMTQVCEQLQQWREMGCVLLPIAINLSVFELQWPDLVQELRTLLKHHDLAPHWLELEVREQDLEQLQGEQLQHLNALADLGVGLTLDDFGSRGLGLEQMYRLPFSRIKLDPSFIRDIHNRYDDNVLLSATISVAKRHGLRVAAKVVETPDQLVYLKLAGCDEVQGHLFSRALSAEELRQYRQHPEQDRSLL